MKFYTMLIPKKNHIGNFNVLPYVSLFYNSENTYLNIGWLFFGVQFKLK